MRLSRLFSCYVDVDEDDEKRLCIHRSTVLVLVLLPLVEASTAGFLLEEEEGEHVVVLVLVLDADDVDDRVALRR